MDVSIAAGGDRQATVSFESAVFDIAQSDAGITSYTVTASPGGAHVTSAGGSPLTVAGLASGTTYTFTVTASNAGGSSPPSAPSNRSRRRATCS